MYSKDKPPLSYLNEFLKNNFPDASILTRIAGGVPSAKPLDKIVMNGVMLVGDAAHQANPITGGGIVNAMKAGRIAGEVAAEAIIKGNMKLLKKYAEKWDKSVGKINKSSYRIKKVIFGFSDGNLNRLSKVIAGIPAEKLTLREIFISAIKKHPPLLMDVVNVFK